MSKNVDPSKLVKSLGDLSPSKIREEVAKAAQQQSTAKK